MGIKASSTRPLILEDVKVPVENLLGEPGRGHVIAFNILNIGRYKLAVGSVGAMKTALEMGVKYAKERKQFKTAIANFPLIQQKLADMNTRTFVAESMAYRATGDIDKQLESLGDARDGRAVAKAIEEYALECSVEKVFASEALDFVVDENVQIHGGYGFIQDYGAERAYRDSRINRIFEGTNEINRLIIPDTLMRKAMKGELPLLQVVQSLDLSGSFEEPASDEPLAHETHLLSLAKKVFLFSAGNAVQKYLQSLKDEQEILAHLADMIIEVYAIESALLRTKKALAKSAADHKVDMTCVYTEEAFERIRLSARSIFAAMEEGEKLQKRLALLTKLTAYTPVNSKTLKRRIAQRVIDAEKYLA